MCAQAAVKELTLVDGQSKLGDMILAKEMDRRYRKDGIISVSVHPGVISAYASL